MNSADPSNAINIFYQIHILKNKNQDVYARTKGILRPDKFFKKYTQYKNLFKQQFQMHLLQTKSFVTDTFSKKYHQKIQFYRKKQSQDIFKCQLEDDVLKVNFTGINANVKLNAQSFVRLCQTARFFAQTLPIIVMLSLLPQKSQISNAEFIFTPAIIYAFVLYYLIDQHDNLNKFVAYDSLKSKITLPFSTRNKRISIMDYAAITVGFYSSQYGDFAIDQNENPIDFTKWAQVKRLFLAVFNDQKSRETKIKVLQKNIALDEKQIKNIQAKKQTINKIKQRVMIDIPLESQYLQYAAKLDAIRQVQNKLLTDNASIINISNPGIQSISIIQKNGQQKQQQAIKMLSKNVHQIHGAIQVLDFFINALTKQNIYFAQDLNKKFNIQAIPYLAIEIMNVHVSRQISKVILLRKVIHYKVQLQKLKQLDVLQKKVFSDTINQLNIEFVRIMQQSTQKIKVLIVKSLQKQQKKQQNLNQIIALNTMKQAVQQNKEITTYLNQSIQNYSVFLKKFGSQFVQNMQSAFKRVQTTLATMNNRFLRELAQTITPLLQQNKQLKANFNIIIQNQKTVNQKIDQFGGKLVKIQNIIDRNIQSLDQRRKKDLIIKNQQFQNMQGASKLIYDKTMQGIMVLQNSRQILLNQLNSFHGQIQKQIPNKMMQVLNKMVNQVIEANKGTIVTAARALQNQIGANNVVVQRFRQSVQQIHDYSLIQQRNATNANAEANKILVAFNNFIQMIGTLSQRSLVNTNQILQKQKFDLNRVIQESQNNFNQMATAQNQRIQQIARNGENSSLYMEDLLNKIKGKIQTVQDFSKLNRQTIQFIKQLPAMLTRVGTTMVRLNQQNRRSQNLRNRLLQQNQIQQMNQMSSVINPNDISINNPTQVMQEIKKLSNEIAEMKQFIVRGVQNKSEVGKNVKSNKSKLIKQRENVQNRSFNSLQQQSEKRKYNEWKAQQMLKGVNFMDPSQYKSSWKPSQFRSKITQFDEVDKDHAEQFDPNFFVEETRGFLRSLTNQMYLVIAQLSLVMDQIIKQKSQQSIQIVDYIISKLDLPEDVFDEMKNIIKQTLPLQRTKLDDLLKQQLASLWNMDIKLIEDLFQNNFGWRLQNQRTGVARYGLNLRSQRFQPDSQQDFEEENIKSNKKSNIKSNKKVKK